MAQNYRLVVGTHWQKKAGTVQTQYSYVDEATSTIYLQNLSNSNKQEIYTILGGLMLREVELREGAVFDHDMLTYANSRVRQVVEPPVQLPGTRRQYIVTYPIGKVGEITNNELAEALTNQLLAGKSIVIPKGWTVQVVYLDKEPIWC